MIRLLLSAILLLSCSALALAQTGTVTGKITDQETKEPVIGVSVLIQGTSLGSITDLSGGFEIKNVPAGAQMLIIKYIGYEDVVQPVNVTAGQTVAVPEVMLSSNAVELNAVEVFSNVVEDRKTPVAVSTIDAVQIDEQLGAMALPEILNSTPGVYATEGDGAFGDAYMNIRGFGQEEVLFLVNGVPTNDMETGIMYWSNFAGLSEMTRTMQVQRGLGASKLGVNSVGGTVNIVTNPAEKKKGGSAEVTMSGNNSYTNRYRFSLSSGLMKGGWAFSMQGVRTTGEGVRPGTYVDAYAYFLSLSKKINDRHTLLLTAFGAPMDRGRFYGNDTETYDRYNNDFFNEAAGYYNGQLYNVSQNKAHKPQATLMHLWTVNDRLTVTSSAYFSLARIYGTSVVRGVGVPVMNPTTDGLQDLEGMHTLNLANQQTITNPYGEPFGSAVSGAQSKYMVEARYNNHNWYGLISNATYQLDETSTLVVGLDVRDYVATHYAQVHDLLGGDFWLDVYRFTGEDNNLLTPNRIARKGDKIRQENDGHVRWGSVFVQLEKTIDKFDVFASANVSRTQMWRVGKMWSGVQDDDFYNNYIANSLGESDKRVFNNYNVKGGVNYRITGRHQVFANGGKLTRAPFMQNAFEESDYSNNFLQNLKSEDIYAVEMGYQYRTSKLKVGINAYHTEWKNKGFFNTATTDFVDPVTETRQTITGISARHRGVELDFSYEPVSSLEISGAFSRGDWMWTNNGSATFDDGEGGTRTVMIYTKGLRVGNAPQTTAFIGAHYKGIDKMYVGFRLNFYADLYGRFDPAERLTGYREVRKLPDYQIFDLYAGHYFNIGELRSRISANVHNLFDVRAIRRSEETFGADFYANPINYNASFTLYF